MSRFDPAALDFGTLLTDGGLETWLVFHRAIDLPEFAAFDLLKDEEGTDLLRGYYEPYLEIARRHGAGFILESPTWRASPKWGEAIGYSAGEIENLNHKAIDLLSSIRDANGDINPIFISGCVGPHGDGYKPEEMLSADQSADYHSQQISALAEAGADLITAVTMTNSAEAIGVARAARDKRLPVVISYTVETDGRLPSGQPLGEAITETDEATGNCPTHFMVNCAHPSHFDHLLEGDAPWMDRISGIRANASTRSHAELDESEQLDEGDAEDLAARYMQLRSMLPQLKVIGGCCGTDYRHVGAIAEAWFAGDAAMV